MGAPIGVEDPENQEIDYRLEGDDAQYFKLRREDGQILTRQPLDYEDRALYHLTVVVRDKLFAEAETSVTIDVEDVNEDPPPPPPPPPPDPLTARFALSVECTDGLCRAETGETVTFTGSAKVVTRRSWNFGDGTARTTSRETRHAWSDPGFYEVALTVTDTATGEAREYVNDPGEPAPAIVDNAAFPGACRP